MTSFDDEVIARLRANSGNTELEGAAGAFMRVSTAPKYSYNFSWLGRPIIQYPQDMVAMQELIWRVQPDLIVETGIAHGGSLIFYASLLELNAACGGPRDAKVLGIDIDIRSHNRAAIESHPLARRIKMLEGPSTHTEISRQAVDAVTDGSVVMVCLDSNHTQEHVLAELELYAPLVTPESYCVVFDTIIERLPADAYPDRPWGPGNSPGSAVVRFLASHPEFVADDAIDAKLMISVAPGGYLRRRA